MTKRRRLGLVRARQRRTAEAQWENPLVQVYGEGWRGVRDSCTIATEWTQKENDFVVALCNKWGLRFSIQPLSTDRTLVARTEPSKTIAEILPPFELHPDDSWWEVPRKRVKVVMDNSAVVGIANGYNKLEHPFIEPDFIRINDTMYNLININILPQHSGADFVVWRRRAFNKQADHIANLALLHNEPARFIDEAALAVALSGDFSLLFYVDGAFWPADYRAAGAWILYGFREGTFELLAFQAVLLHGQKS